MIFFTLNEWNKLESNRSNKQFLCKSLFSHNYAVKWMTNIKKKFLRVLGMFDVRLAFTSVAPLHSKSRHSVQRKWYILGECHNLIKYTECCYAECPYAQRRWAECHHSERHNLIKYSECCYAECPYAKRRSSECHYSQRHCSECHHSQLHCSECHHSQRHSAASQYAEWPLAKCRCSDWLSLRCVLSGWVSLLQAFWCKEPLLTEIKC